MAATLHATLPRVTGPLTYWCVGFLYTQYVFEPNSELAVLIVARFYNAKITTMFPSATEAHLTHEPMVYTTKRYVG